MRARTAVVVALALVGGALVGNAVRNPQLAVRSPQSARTPGSPCVPRQLADCGLRTAAPGLRIADHGSDISFYERRVAEDSQSAIDRGILASLYVQRARSTGNVDDYARAETLARRSLALRTARNGQTFALLASTLVARHAFAEALAVARRADSLEPGVAAHLALMGEIELEIGEYAGADSHFAAIRYDGEQFAVGARLARWRELSGHSDRARRLLVGAAAHADRRDDLPREQVAWFHYRLGELELRTGRLDAADSALHRGLAIFPGDYRILGALARLAAARERWTESIAYGDRAIAIQLDPTTLGTISDAWNALGDSARAAEYARAMTVNALHQPGPIHRAWGMFVLDHGSAADARRVLAKARAERRERVDVYGDDLLAWSLHRLGRSVEARTLIASALARGTEDAQLHYHAGMIARATGDAGEAIRQLERAMSLNARFSPSQSPIARRTLDSLRAALPRDAAKSVSPSRRSA